MSIHHSLLTSSALYILKVRRIVHEEVFGEDCGAEGVAEDVEVFFPVGIGVREIGSDSFAWEVLFCCGVEAFGDEV